MFSLRWNVKILFMEKNINEDLDQVVKWFKMNIMVISLIKIKCYCMFVVGKWLCKCLDNINLDLNIFLNGVIIDQVKSYKFFGFYLD